MLTHFDIKTHIAIFSCELRLFYKHCTVEFNKNNFKVLNTFSIQRVLSRRLEKTLRNTLCIAIKHQHEYAISEQFLLALTQELDAKGDLVQKNVPIKELSS